MNELDVERTLTDEWQAFVAAARTNPPLGATTVEARGARITRPVLWAELEDVRLAFAEVHAALDDVSKADVLATTRWSVKDLVAHIASWAAEFRRQIETAAAGEAFDYLITFTPRVGPTEWNARELDRRRAMSLDDRFHEFDAETARIQELALALPDDVLFMTAELPQTPDGLPEHRWRTRLADLMLMKCFHDRYHLDRIRDLLGLDIAD
jgi:mycothiol maleylpyruvate isomerase-like protein